jgi:hypothetical protein
MSDYNKLLLKILNPYLANGNLNLEKNTKVNREIVKEIIIDLPNRLRDNLKNATSIEQYRLLSNYKKAIEKLEHRYPGISKDIQVNDIER